MTRFARWYEERVFNPLMDRALAAPQVSELRTRLLAGARGRVLEVGIGTGLNLPHYPAAVRSLEALVREDALDARVLSRARASARAVAHVRGDAARAPLPSRCVDTLVCTFVLCSVDDPRTALAEFARLLAPGGQLLIAEHVRSPRSIERAVQRALTPLHRHWACGCRLDRDLGADLASTGLQLAPLAPPPDGALPFPARELLCGVARLR
jgi:ubiquinone/menaquinone biosynthesis C-methylase UbiE